MNAPSLDRSSPVRRKSLRVPTYDYATPGAYFVTCVTRNRECFLGEMVGGQMVLNACGLGVSSEWTNLASRFQTVELDTFVVMPNHVHGVVWLNDTRQAYEEGAASSAPTLGYEDGAASDEGAASSAPTLSAVMRAFKSLSASSVNRIRGTSGHVWQRNYYEHVVRDQRELDEVRKYIVENPLRWSLDSENPLVILAQ